jgi:hypothetical protein
MSLDVTIVMLLVIVDLLLLLSPSELELPLYSCVLWSGGDSMRGGRVVGFFILSITSDRDSGGDLDGVAAIAS